MNARMFVAAGVLITAVALTGSAVALVPELPGFLPADDQRPVASPQHGQQVVVAQVLLGSDGEQISAEVRSVEVIDSVAPKVVARSGGEWEVRLSGGKELVYQIPNPLDDIEAERLEDEKQPYESVPVDSFDWTLIAPLYYEAEDIGATTVHVLDLETGQVIIEFEIPKTGD